MLSNSRAWLAICVSLVVLSACSEKPTNQNTQTNNKDINKKILLLTYMTLTMQQSRLKLLR